MKATLLGSAVLIGAATSVANPSYAQDVEFGTDALAGIADNSLETGKNTQFSGGVLPSVKYESSGLLIQADAMLFDHRKDTALGGALHAGLAFGEGNFVGVYGSISRVDLFDGLQTKRIGGEAKLSSGPFSLAGVAGYEKVESDIYLIGTTATDDVYYRYGRGGKFFSFVDAKFKASDAFELSVGHRYTGGRHAAAASAAYAISSNVAFIFQGRAGSGSYQAGFGGLRVLFGGKSDRPMTGSLLDNRLIEDLFSAANTRRTVLDPLPPPVDEEDDGGEGNYCGSCGGYCGT